VRPRDARTTRLLEDAARSAGEDAPPPLLIVLSARFGRVQWKYERLAYALILKNVGVAMQTFALSAETMGLAACVLGGGDSALFAEAAGTDPFEESSVGEIMIGERDAGETP
jgi:SagB-type dehydrogenase family enzyme